MFSYAFLYKQKRKNEVKIMGLINCPECGNQMSDQAKSCPNCGAPRKETKFCKYCGEQIDKECVVCPKCGKQIEQLNDANKNIVINNNTSASASATVITPVVVGKAKNKWVAFLLCLFLGYFGIHKFYEEKVGMGILYIFTFGLFGFGWIIDAILLLFKPNPYYV